MIDKVNRYKALRPLFMGAHKNYEFISAENQGILENRVTLGIVIVIFKKYISFNGMQFKYLNDNIDIFKVF